MTGSVKQRGEIQAIGGVTQKVEGWYDVCLERGLIGEQGVMILASNASDLMLRVSVVEAVAAGKFHIWSVETVDEGIEVLTGRPAAKEQAKLERMCYYLLVFAVYLVGANLRDAYATKPK